MQRPRPPITIAAHGPKMLRIAAERADAWSSWGGYGVVTEDDFYRVTADRSHRFDDLASRSGATRHDPALAGVLPAADPVEVADYFPDMVGRLREIGIDEFVLYWPQAWQDAPGEDAVFEEVAHTVIPELRTDTGFR